MALPAASPGPKAPKVSGKGAIEAPKLSGKEAIELVKKAMDSRKMSDERDPLAPMKRPAACNKRPAADIDGSRKKASWSVERSREQVMARVGPKGASENVGFRFKDHVVIVTLNVFQAL